MNLRPPFVEPPDASTEQLAMQRLSGSVVAQIVDDGVDSVTTRKEIAQNLVTDVVSTAVQNSPR